MITENTELHFTGSGLDIRELSAGLKTNSGDLLNHMDRKEARSTTFPDLSSIQSEELYVLDFPSSEKGKPIDEQLESWSDWLVDNNKTVRLMQDRKIHVSIECQISSTDTTLPYEIMPEVLKKLGEAGVTLNMVFQCTQDND